MEKTPCEECLVNTMCKKYISYIKYEKCKKFQDWIDINRIEIIIAGLDIIEEELKK